MMRMERNRTHIVAWLVLFSGLAIATEASRAGSVLSAGFLHICGIQADRTLICWGSDEYGQSSPPTGEFHQVSAGAYFNCALDLEGAIQCWGRDTAGETSPPTGNYVEIATGNNHSCARKTDNSVICWGASDSSQVSYPGGQFVQLALGNAHSCGLRPDGSIQCWGSNSHGQTESKTDNTFVYIDAGYDTTCGVNRDGEASCWGRTSDTYGYLSQVDFALYGKREAGEPSVLCGLRPDQTISCPTMDPPSGQFVYVASGGHNDYPCLNWCCGSCERHEYRFRPFACGIQDNGIVACWGINDNDRATAPVGVIMAIPPSHPYEFLDPLAFYNPCSIDVDGDGNLDPLTDGLLIMRYLFGFRGDALAEGATTRNGEAIEKCLDSLSETWSTPNIN